MLNTSKGRNEALFDSLANVNANLYHEYGIHLLWHGKENWDSEHTKKTMNEFIDSSSYDYLLIGMDDFVDKNKSIEESTDWGLENLEKITEGGDYILWDGFDSTSLFGTYDVFEKSNAIFLLKNQLLKMRQDYNQPYICGKQFFGKSETKGKSYDIPKNKWDKIKLSGINIGYSWMARQHIWANKGTGRELPGIYDDKINRFFKPSTDKNIDVSAVYLADIGKGYEHNVRNDLLYMNHRKKVWDIIKNTKHNYFVSDAIPYNHYLQKIYDSKVFVSPYGQGEICFRDFELLQLGTIMIKPDMSHLNTSPNIYEDGKTYISCKYDWSDLEEKIDYVLSNYNVLFPEMLLSMRKKFMNEYGTHNVCQSIYDILKEIPSTQEEKVWTRGEYK